MIQKIDITNISISEVIRKSMVVATVVDKGLQSSTDKTAILTKNTWDEFVEIGTRIGLGNSVLFSSGVSWVNSGLKASFPSGIITNKNNAYITVFIITGQTREYRMADKEWGNIIDY